MPDILTCGNVSLNRQNSELSAGGLSFALRKQEYRLMELLMLNHGIFLSTEDLLVKVWGYDTDAELGTSLLGLPSFSEIMRSVICASCFYRAPSGLPAGA